MIWAAFNAKNPAFLVLFVCFSIAEIMSGKFSIDISIIMSCLALPDADWLLVGAGLRAEKI